MASSSGSSGLTSTGGANGLGLVGLNSGLDTQSIIDKMMQYDKAPLNRANQQIQTLQWKEEFYRAQNTALSKLSTSAFDMSLEASFNTRTATSSDSQILTATAASTAATGSYSIRVDRLATYASNSSTGAFLLTSLVIGKAQNSVTIDEAHSEFRLTFDGIQQTIDLSGLLDPDGPGGDPPVTEREFTAGTDLDDLEQAIQDQLDAKFNIDSDGDGTPDHGAAIKVKLTNLGQLEFYTDDGESHNITVNNSVNNNSVLDRLGFTDGQTVTTVNTGIALFDMKDQFADDSYFTTPTDPDNPTSTPRRGDNFKVTINGQTFNFRNTETIDDIIKDINSRTEAGVTAYFDAASSKLMLTAAKSGDYNHGNPGIIIDDPSNAFGSLFKITQNDSKGVDARFSVNGAAPITQSSNTLVLNGVTINMLKEGSTATVTVASDTAAAVKKITDFVNAYNDTLSGLYTQINQARPTKDKKYYDPLTDDQKAEMSDDEITKWEDLAKQGLLRNDSLLLNIANQMRANMSRVLYSPTTLTGNILNDTIDIGPNSNQFTFTLGNQSKLITLDQKTYTAQELTAALQKKLDIAFGTGQVQVLLNSSQRLVFMGQNTSMSLSSGTTNNGLAPLGFNSGARVEASYNSLYQIGITTGDYSENGELHIDTAKLTAALEKDPDGVMRLFTNTEEAFLPDPYIPDGASDAAKEKADKDYADRVKNLTAQGQGIFATLHDTLDLYVGRLTDKAGVADGPDDNTSIGKEINDIQDHADDLQSRLEAEQSRLWTMFNNMETVLSQLNSQTSMLMNMLGMGG